MKSKIHVKINMKIHANQAPATFLYYFIVLMWWKVCEIKCLICPVFKCPYMFVYLVVSPFVVVCLLVQVFLSIHVNVHIRVHNNQRDIGNLTHQQQQKLGDLPNFGHFAAFQFTLYTTF